MLTILLIIGILVLCMITALLVVGAVAISPLLLVFLLCTLLDIVVIGGIIKGVFGKKKKE